MRASLLTLVGLVAGCRCPGPVKPVELAPLEVAPSQLTFPPTFVGSSSRQVVELRNPNVVERPLEPILEGPFTIDPVSAIAPGETLGLSVTFRPLQPGAAQGRLSIETREVLLSGEGRAVPVCTADACHDPRFDEAASQCVMDLAPDGRSCSTRCLPTGSCVRGECLGTTPACDDQNACTVDACSDQLGCVHARRSCQRPVDRCKRAECDPATGCTIVDAPEGTLCGPDDCAASTVDVCLQGRCLTRARPANARCANTWLPLTVPAHTNGTALIAYDETSGLVVLVWFSGLGTQTWRWDGSAWELLLPLNPLPSLRSAGMVVDPATGRPIVIGRGPTKVEQWEWDGTGWFERPISGIDCDSFTLGVEPLTQRLLLSCRAGDFGGSITWQLWSFDGFGWRREPNPPWTAKPEFLSDSSSDRLLAVVNVPVRLQETYQWLFPGFVKMDTATLGFGCGGVDPLSRDAVWFGGSEDGGMRRWRWRANRWLDEGTVLATRAESCLAALDARRNTLVVTGGRLFARSTTWEWDGRLLTELSSGTPELVGPVLATAPSPLLFGHYVSSEAVSYRFTGRGWASGQAIPAGQRAAAAAWDERHSQLLVSLADPNQATRSTWLFDGGSWAIAEASSSGPDPGARVIWSPALERVVAIGTNGPPADAVSIWTGTHWQGVNAAGGPANPYRPAVSTDVTGAPLVVASGIADAGLETFRWVDGGWAPLPRPPIAASATIIGVIALASAYDPGRQRTVLLALPADPSEGGMLTFEWDGSAWTARTPTLSPPRETGVLLAFDPNSQRVLFYEPKQTWAFFP